MDERPNIQQACRENEAISRIFDELIDDIVAERAGKNRLLKLHTLVGLTARFGAKFFVVREGYTCECKECVVIA